MIARGPWNLLLLHLAALLVTGVCQGGAARFYTTNTLTEAEPRVGGDYDALLDQVSGDFGVRSEVLEAAGQEPEYRGADTMVVPLYIPKGAVPIKVARIARSDSRDPVLEVVDLTMSPAADSVLIRRIGPVDRRRAASSPNRAAWRPPQRTRITRLSPVRRSDSPPRRRGPLPSSPSSSLSSSPLSLSLPAPRSSPLQSEFGKRLPAFEGGPADTPAPDTDTATKRAKKNELSKDSQFPEELHTTTLPTTTTTTAATTTTSTSSPSNPKGGEIKATTRRFSTHLTSTTTTTTEPPSTTTSSTTTTKSPPPTTTTTSTPPTTTKKRTTTTTTTPATTTTTDSTAHETPSSTSTTERRSILFPRPVESVLNGRGKSLTPTTTSTTSTTTTTTTTTPATTPATTASAIKTVTSGRGFPVPVRNLPAWVMRPRTPAPPSLPPRRIFITTTTTTTTERPRRVRDKLRRLSRLRGVNKESSTTTTTTTTERSRSTTPTTTTTTTTERKTPPTTTQPSTTTRRSSTVRKMPSVSEILKSHIEEEEEREEDLEESPSDTTLGRPSTTEAYAKTTTLRTVEGKQREDDPSTTTSRTVEERREDDQGATTSRIVEERHQENDQGTTTTQRALEEEIQRTQLHVATEASSVEKVPPSDANRKFVRRPRPPQDSENPEGLLRPSGPRRRRPLRPRIKLPPPITYHRSSTTPPQDTFASTSTTATTTQPPTTTTTTTTTQRPLTTTITVTSASTPRVVLTTTTTTTTTPVPTIASTTKTPAQVVIDSLTEIMKQATNSSRNKDRVYNITAKLESLNRRLAEQGIHIIHAEVDGEKIKLDNRMIIRPRQPAVTTFRPATSLPASTLPSPRPSAPSSSTSFSFFTPSTEEDAQGKQIQTSIRSSFSFHTSHSPDTVNEVQTTTGDSTPTTNKPVEVRKQDDKPFLAPSRFPTAVEGDGQARNTSDPRTPESPSVRISGTRANLDLEGRRGTSTSILATATVPATVTTRTRSTTVPITTHQGATTPSLRHRPTSGSTHQAGDGSQPPDDPRPSTTVHPTSHHRPTFFPPPTDHSHADRTPNPTRIPTIKVVSILKGAEVTGSPATVENVVEDDLQVLKDSQDIKDTPRASYTAIYVISIIGVIPAAGLAFFIARRFLKKTQKALPESEERGEGFTPITHHHSRKTQSSAHATTMQEGEGPSSVEAKNPRFTPWEFPRSKLRLASILGQGNFGVVWKAEARDLCACEGSQGGPTVLVAVKGVKEGAGQKEKQDLLKELAIMQHLGHHTNVVTLLGCCTQQEPYYVIMEYVMFGKLLTFLRDHRTRQNYYNFSSDTAALTSQDLTRFACQVASGCEYIQSRGIIHRDLASRNVLVDHNKVCKIADFGLARSVKDLGSDIYEQKSRGALPIRWMAPESLYMSIFTHKSDVWSLGILCWEIVTLGSTPYPGMTAREVMRQVREGYRLERPEHCHQELYHIVTRCWHQDLNQRPSFTEIKEDLQELLENSPTGYIDLENFPESSYYSMHENNEEKL